MASCCNCEQLGLIVEGSPSLVWLRAQESNNRAARQRIPHRIYTDNEGREHVQACSHTTCCLALIDFTVQFVISISQGCEIALTYRRRTGAV